MKDLTILVIDDEEFVRVLLNDLLDEYATKILELDDGRFALDVIESQSPDLVIADIVMPEKDGLEIVRETKEKYPSLPVYIISAYPEYIDIAAEMGADEIFPKPIETDRLVECINSLKSAS